jgi:flagellar M-ring protein FliF
LSPARQTQGQSLGGTATKAKQRATEVLAGFSHGQRAMVGITVLVAVVGGYLFLQWASKPTYLPLFTNLDASDAAAITQKLTSDKVPYQLDAGGSTVEVPSGDVYQQRLDMSAAGLPSSTGSGYTLLDKAGITTSDFQQQVEYQQAVQTELDNTIEAMDGVSSAVVHVVIPQQSIFGTGGGSASASVLLEMETGVTLDSTQVQAIVHLVASSIEGLNPDDVTVVDSKGDVLNAPGSDAAELATGDAQAQETQQFDQSLNTSIEQLLSPVVGSGNVVADVAATLDYATTSTSSKTYATKPVAVSTSTSNEKYTGGAASTAAAGVLGVSGTTGTTTTAKGKGSTYVDNTASTQYAASEIDQSTQNAPGAIERLSVAVMLNSRAKGVDIPAIKALVASAVGLRASRGDTIAVESLPFAAVAAAAVTTKATATSKMSGLITEAVTAILLLVTLALVFLALRKLRKPIRIPIQLPAELNAPAPSLALPGVEPPTMLLKPVSGQLSAVREMGDAIDRDPARVAELLRDWLAEDRV